MSNINITAIMPFQNAASYLNKSFENLDSIDFPDLEIVCVDDGSTDNSYELAQEWASRTRHTVKLLRLSESDGVARARNYAIRHASGRFVWFLDSDDEWSPDILEHLWSGLTDDSVDMVFCNAERVIGATGHRKIINDAPSRKTIDGAAALDLMLAGELQGHLWNKLIRRELAISCPFPPLRTVSDLGGVARMLTEARLVSFTPGVKYFYLVRANSLFQSSDSRWRNLQEVSEIIESLVQNGAGNANTPRLLRRFRYTTIMIPSLHAMAMRGTVRKNQVPYLDSLTFGNVIRLASEGKVKLAAQCALASWGLPLYVHLYKKYALKTWGPIG